MALGEVPLVCHPGGKRRLLDKILPVVPRHEKYVEGFAGGAALYLAKEQAPKGSVLADTDADLMKMYRKLDCQKLNRLMAEFSRRGPAFVENLQKKYSAGKKLTPEQYWLLKSKSYACAVGSGVRVKSMSDRAPSACPASAGKIRKAKLIIADFRKAMRSARGKNTFVYLDPPYPGRGEQIYGKPTIQPEDVAREARSFPGKVLVSYSDTPSVRKAFRGFWIKTLKGKSNMREWKCRSRGGKKDCAVQRELLIANYRFQGARKL